MGRTQRKLTPPQVLSSGQAERVDSRQRRTSTGLLSPPSDRLAQSVLPDRHTCADAAPGNGSQVNRACSASPSPSFLHLLKGPSSAVPAQHSADGLSPSLELILSEAKVSAKDRRGRVGTKGGRNTSVQKKKEEEEDAELVRRLSRASESLPCSPQQAERVHSSVASVQKPQLQLSPRGATGQVAAGPVHRVGSKAKDGAGTTSIKKSKAMPSGTVPLSPSRPPASQQLSGELHALPSIHVATTLGNTTASAGWEQEESLQSSAAAEPSCQELQRQARVSGPAVLVDERGVTRAASTGDRRSPLGLRHSRAGSMETQEAAGQAREVKVMEELLEVRSPMEGSGQRSSGSRVRGHMRRSSDWTATTSQARVEEESISPLSSCRTVGSSWRDANSTTRDMSVEAHEMGKGQSRRSSGRHKGGKSVHRRKTDDGDDADVEEEKAAERKQHRRKPTIDIESMMDDGLHDALPYKYVGVLGSR